MAEGQHGQILLLLMPHIYIHSSKVMKAGNIGRARCSNVRAHGKHSSFTLQQRMGSNSVPSTDDMKKHEEHFCTLLVLPSRSY